MLVESPKKAVEYPKILVDSPKILVDSPKKLVDSAKKKYLPDLVAELFSNIIDPLRHDWIQDLECSKVFILII